MDKKNDEKMDVQSLAESLQDSVIKKNVPGNAQIYRDKLSNLKNGPSSPVKPTKGFKKDSLLIQTRLKDDPKSTWIRRVICSALVFAGFFFGFLVHAELNSPRDLWSRIQVGPAFESNKPLLISEFELNLVEENKLEQKYLLSYRLVNQGKQAINSVKLKLLFYGDQHEFIERKLISCCNKPLQASAREVFTEAISLKQGSKFHSYALKFERD